jgi:hypothetical protein
VLARTNPTVIFLDVDGTVIPFCAGPTRDAGSGSAVSGGNPLLDLLDPALGPRLLALGCELMWATTWMARANEEVSQMLGLPMLPVVTWSEAADDPPRGLHWKTQDLVGWAAGRRFVWLDDEIRPADQAWVAAHHPAPALLHRVDPRVGLADEDFASIRRWLSHR